MLPSMLRMVSINAEEKTWTVQSAAVLDFQVDQIWFPDISGLAFVWVWSAGKEIVQYLLEAFAKSGR